MKLHRKLFLLLLVGFSFASGSAAGQEGGWLEKWLVPDPGIFLWTIVTFFFVLAILAKFAWKPMIEALDAREERILNSLNAAEAAKAGAEKAGAEQQVIIQQAQVQAQEAVAKGKTAGEKIQREIENKSQEKAESIIAQAKLQIDAEREKAIKEIKSVVIDISIAAATKIIERNMDSKDNRKIVEETLKQIGQA